MPNNNGTISVASCLWAIAISKWWVATEDRRKAGEKWYKLIPWHIGNDALTTIKKRFGG